MKKMIKNIKALGLDFFLLLIPYILLLKHNKSSQLISSIYVTKLSVHVCDYVYSVAMSIYP
jgi:hypothetical protein